MEKEYSGQSVILIRSGELPANYANWGLAGWYVPPLGTALTGTDTITLDNSSTGASNTPGEPIFEIVEGKSVLSYTIDDDDKETMDASTDIIEHDPGKAKLDLNMDMWPKLGTSRFGGARRFHPTNKEYRRTFKYPRYGLLVVVHPLDSSDNPVHVDSAITKDSFEKAKKVLYFRGVTWKSRPIEHGAGEKIMYSLPGNAEQVQEFNEYEFESELYPATALTVGNVSLASQPKIPTRLKIVISVWAAAGDIIFVGKDEHGNTLTETVTGPIATGTYYTDNVFASVDASGVQVQGAADYTMQITAGELY
jgi:hypothetical protein